MATVQSSTTEFTMKSTRMMLVITGFALSLSASAQDIQRSKEAHSIEPLPRDLEVQLALSALPPHLRDGATAYVLNPDKGFEVARKGTNQFHAIVARTGDDTFRGTWRFTKYRDDILYPVSFNRAGSRSHMRVFFDAAEMQARGTPPDELKKIIQARFKDGTYKAPERAGVSYMLSPILRTYVDPEVDDKVETANYPHVMYFAPGLSKEDIGGGELGGEYTHIIMPGHHGHMIQPLGKQEAAAIAQEYAGMLTRLCKIKEVWCLPKQGSTS